MNEMAQSGRPSHHSIQRCRDVCLLHTHTYISACTSRVRVSICTRLERHAELRQP
ncbi:hypothetical protein BDW67DRAFT_160657 [Aspergillus spinulosporus]